MRKDERIENRGGRIVKHSPSEEAERADARPFAQSAARGAASMPKAASTRTLVEGGKAAERGAALAQYRALHKEFDEHQAKAPSSAFAPHGAAGVAGMLHTPSSEEHAAKGKALSEQMRVIERAHPGIYHMSKAADAREKGHEALAQVHEKAAAAVNGEWDEAKHPRDEQGRFT